MWCRHSPGLACRLSISYSICDAAAKRVFAIQSARGSPDWPSALISLPMSYSTRRIESVAPSIKRCEANLPTTICAARLAPAALFSIGCVGLPAVLTVQSQAYFKQTSAPAATHRLLRSFRGGNERNITKSLTDRFWADHAQLGSCTDAFKLPINGLPVEVHPLAPPSPLVGN